MGQRDSVLARLAVEAELSLTSAKLKEASGTRVIAHALVCTPTPCKRMDQSYWAASAGHATAACMTCCIP